MAGFGLAKTGEVGKGIGESASCQRGTARALSSDAGWPSGMVLTLVPAWNESYRSDDCERTKQSKA